MGLPIDLVPYAENFYRRFPEEFVALGMPGLEEVFDLRPNGTWTRHIDDTPTEKKVEITIRRWQMPSLMPSANGFAGVGSRHPQSFAALLHQQQHQHDYLQMHSQLQNSMTQPQAPFFNQYAASMGAAMRGAHMQPACPSAAPCCSPGSTAPGAFGTPGFGPGPLSQMGGAGDWQSGGAQSAPAAAAPAPVSDQANSRIMRLETAVSALKPQIEALLTAQSKAQAQLEAHTQLQQASQAAAAVAAAAAAAAASSPPAAAAAPTPPYPVGGHNHAADLAKVAGAPPPQPQQSVPDGLESNDLRARRQMMNLQIQTHPKAPPPETKAADNADGQGGQGIPRVTSNNALSTFGSNDGANAEGEGTKARPKVIQAVRVAPSTDDPASPRSPARHSAWK